MTEEEKERIRTKLDDFNESDIDSTINDFQAKIDKLIKRIPKPLKKIWDDIKILYQIFKGATNKSLSFKVPKKDLLLIGGALTYFIIPVDIIPDFLGPPGYVDDATVLSGVISTLKKTIDIYKCIYCRDDNNVIEQN